MAETQPALPAGNKKTLAIVLGLIGLILLFAGVAIVTIHNPLRGSGLGTVSLVLGALLLVGGLWRFTTKR